MNADLLSLYILGSLFIIYFAFSFPAVLQVYFSNAIERHVEKKIKGGSNGPKTKR